MAGEERTGPIYQQIKADLRAAVARGEYQPGSTFVTQRELCERYGVSTTTAVKALNDLVAEGLLVRRRGRGTFVADPAEASTTEPAAAGRAVACIVHGLIGPHIANIVRGVESVCAEAGYRMYLADTARPGGVNASTELEARALRDAVDSQVAGIVLYPVEGQNDSELLAEVRRRGIPLVLVDRYRPEIPTDTVTVDNFAIGYQLTERLIEAGHRNIMTLWSETDTTSVRDRLTGHVRALRDNDLPVRLDLSALRPYLSHPESVRLAMLSELLDAPEPPTVALCANGFVVACAAKDLVALGRSVPGDIELAGMDSAGPFDVLPLTIVAAELPSMELGIRAMDLLVERITGTADAPSGQHIMLPTKVRTREVATGYLRAAPGTSA